MRARSEQASVLSPQGEIRRNALLDCYPLQDYGPRS